MSNGAEVVADALMDSLLVGEVFTVPTVNLNDPAFNFPSIVGNPLYNAVSELTNEDLTTRTVGGTGTYDAIMASQAAHLKDEFNQGRITGAEYTKAYIALAQAAAGQAIQFLLGKDQAYWASVIAQGQALTARVQLETAKAQLAIALIEVNNQRATFALNKIRLANEDAQYGITNYTLLTKLPAENAMMTSQKAVVDAQKTGQDKANEIAAYTLSTKLPAEVAMLASQKLGVEKSTEIAAYTLTNLNPAQLTLIKEQGEAQRAQTLDTRSDAAAVAGSVKSQKDLYAQQVISYKRSSEVNAAKIFTDAWVADSAIQDSPIVPTAFSSANISSVLTSIKTLNGL
jgi:hypothetical protein